MSNFFHKYSSFIGIALLSACWFSILMFPFVMGFLFCPFFEDRCFVPMRFEFSLWDGSYPLTEKVVYVLDTLSQVHRYFGVTKLGPLLVAGVSLALGAATYWLVKKVLAWRRTPATP